jgi:hypothetical protein
MQLQLGCVHRTVSQEYNITVVEPLVMKGQDVSDLPDRYQTYLAKNGEERFVTMRRAALETSAPHPLERDRVPRRLQH